jgi:hypothetical protein
MSAEFEICYIFAIGTKKKNCQILGVKYVAIGTADSVKFAPVPNSFEILS